MSFKIKAAKVKSNRHTAIIIITVGAALAVSAVLSVFAGKYQLDAKEVISAFAHRGDETAIRVVWGLRIPRTVMGIIAGCALGLSGYVYQTVFKNPLASPDLIGVAGGANLGAAIMIVIGAGSAAAVTVGAFAGGIAAVISVIALASLAGRGNVSYVLGGIVINAISGAGVMALKYFADPENQLVSIEYWEMGTLGTVTWTRIMAAILPVIIGMTGLLLLSEKTTLLSLGDDECRTLGVRLVPTRIAILGLNTLLVAAVVSVTGLISFVGLIAPHIANLLLRRKGLGKMVLSALTGGVVVVAADILARVIYDAELPISILTTVTGVPILIWLLIKGRKTDE